MVGLLSVKVRNEVGCLDLPHSDVHAKARAGSELTSRPSLGSGSTAEWGHGHPKRQIELVGENCTSVRPTPTPSPLKRHTLEPHV